jgi:MFS family permease
VTAIVAGTPPQRYRDALAIGEFRVLFAAYAISMIGSVVSAVALMVLVYDRTSSSLLASLTFALAFLPYLVSGTLLSATVDRLPMRTLLVGGDLACACVIAVMALRGIPVTALLLLLLVLGTVSGVSGGARNAVIPSMVPPSAYIPARSLMRITAQATQIGGNAVGGGLLVFVSPRMALLLNVCSYLASAVLIRIGTRARPPAHCEVEARLLSDSMLGLRTVLGDAPLRRLLLLNWLVPTFAVAPEALAAPYVSGLGGSDSLVGWWLVAIPLGFVVGDVIAIWAVSAAWQARLVGPLATCVFVPLLVFVLAPGFALAFVLLALSGAAAAYGLGLDARIRSAAAPALLGRVLAINMAGLVALQGLGFAAAGALAEVVSPATAIVAAGVTGLAVVAAFWPRDDRR